MLKATQDFTYASMSVKAGEVIQPYQFEADQVQILLANGLIASETPQLKETKKAQPGKKAASAKS